MNTYSKRDQLKATMFLRAFALRSIPLLLICQPKVLSLSAELTEIVIPLNFITKNHLGSMYFGAIAIGADVSVGLYAAQAFEKARRKQKKRVSFVFKEMQMSFLKRPDGDVHFRVSGGAPLEEFIEKVLTSNERHNIRLPGVAVVPKKYGNEPMARFELVLSAKQAIS